MHHCGLRFDETVFAEDVTISRLRALRESDVKKLCLVDRAVQSASTYISSAGIHQVKRQGKKETRGVRRIDKVLRLFHKVLCLRAVRGLL